MSRIGKLPIPVPKGVSVNIDGNHVSVKGPKGELQRKLHNTVSVEQQGEEIHVKPRNTSYANRKFHGLSRSLLANMVEGVANGFTKKLILKGVGYKAQVSGDSLNLTLGYSHPVIYKIPEGISASVAGPEVTLTSANKELLGQAAANIRSFRKPEPYHGKGVRYADERIITKVGKSGSK